MRWVVGVVLAGCYSPSPKAGTPCSVTSECPAPFVCEIGVCGPGGHGGDSGLPDGDITDADVAEDSAPSDAMLFTPSNGVDPSTALGLTEAIVVDGNATFNVETGRITGALSRPSGVGVMNGIGYEQRMFGTTPLAVFSFHSLEVQDPGRIQFSGTRAVVFVVSREVSVAGDIDLAGCSAGACPGPGGGNGTLYTATGGGCGGGRGGVTNNNNAGDSGGGGGAGGTNGAKGGDDDENGNVLAGGAGGLACIPETLEPLVGGSGGAGGGPGVIAGVRGGSGGGALQITAFGSIAISGVIDAAGGGGGAGGTDPNGNNAGAGAGGGAGGGILLEAPSVTLAATGILVANGGGGGGASNGTASGQPGQPGTRSTTPATGGASGNGNGDGGAGAALAAPATPGENVVDGNGGGGGGGVGRIRIRAGTQMITGTTSPVPTAAAL